MQDRWWSRTRHEDRRPFLMARGRIRGAVRDWFAARDFVEVETGQLQAAPGSEVHLHPFETTRAWPDGTRQPRWLHTSPEHACKKLLAAGEERIFELARVFRNDEAQSPLHAAEFTMLEWYRAGADWRAVAQDALDLACAALAAAGTDGFSWRGGRAPAGAAPMWLSVADAVQAHAGIDILATLDPAGQPDRAALAAACRAQGLTVRPDDGWSDLFTEVLVARVEPALPRDRPVILHDYPAPEAALARRSPEDPRVAERFELYVCGVELANGYGELSDAAEQRARFVTDAARRAAIQGRDLPIDEELLEALPSMGPAGGVALGFDRLVLLATGARSLADVMWTPPA